MNTLSIQPVQIIPSFAGYGADRLVADLHKSFLQRGVRSHVISFMEGQPLGISSIDNLGLRKPYHPAAVLRLAKKFKEIVKQEPARPILLHAHLTPCQLYVPLAAKIAGLNTPLLTTEHSTNNRRRTVAFGKFFDRKLYKPYGHVVCISEGVKDSISHWLPEMESKLITIPNGVNIDDFDNTPHLDQNSECPIIISVGRLQKIKNYQTAINACALLKDLNFEYHILGDGDEKPALRKLIGEKGLTNKVKLLGFQPNVARHLSQSNIFLMTSYWEGFGLAVVEAMACGLPVVVSDVPGVRETVGQRQKSGFLVDPRDSVGIAEKLRKLILSSKLCTEMGEYNRLCAKRYSIERTAQGYLDLYQKVFSYNAC